MTNKFERKNNDVGEGRKGGRKERQSIGRKNVVKTGPIEHMVSSEEDMPQPPTFKATNFYYGGFKCNSLLPPDGTLARSVISTKSDSFYNYFVMMDGGELFNPAHKSFTYLRRAWELKRTNKQVFDLYLGFLSSQKEQYLHKAERYING